jgi:hypothetical protein
MLNKNILLTFLIILFAVNIFAQGGKGTDQSGSYFTSDKNSEVILTGNLQVDNQLSFNAVQTEISKRNLNLEPEGSRSPWLGALFSFILPGAGEVYAESYWKAGIFVAIEAAVITTAVVYNNKGNDATDAFEKFADNVSSNTGWSVVRYAEWLNQNYQGDIYINPDESLPPWKRVDFNEIHAVENQHSDLSHQLAYYGEQQYYEMIGKYHQFRAGWADYTSDLGFNVSPLFHEYSGMRATANDYYNTASKAVIGIYINHFLSAIDAYWSTTIYNKELVANMTVENRQFGRTMVLVPTINLKLSF